MINKRGCFDVVIIMSLSEGEIDHIESWSD